MRNPSKVTNLHNKNQHYVDGGHFKKNGSWSIHSKHMDTLNPGAVSHIQLFIHYFQVTTF